MKSLHITFYRKPKRVTILALDSDLKNADFDEINGVDHVNFAELDDYPEMELSSKQKEREKQP